MENQEIKVSKKLKQVAIANKPLDLAETNASLVAERFKDLKEVGQAIKNQLVDTTDYYTLPDADKPALSKVGASKICLAFGFTCKSELVHKVENYGNGEEAPYFQYTYKATLHKGDKQYSEATASCNSRENSWGKASENPYSIISNIMLKAQKRAYVQAVLLIANVGEIFTSDMDEIKAKKALETIGQKQLMLLYTMTPVDKETDTEKKKQRALRCKEICKEFSKRHNDNIMSYPEVTKDKLESFKAFLKDYRMKWSK